MNYVAGEEEEW